MSAKLTDSVVCPVCKGTLLAAEGQKPELICPACGLAYEVKNGIPVMLRTLARTLTEEETARYREAAEKVAPNAR